MLWNKDRNLFKLPKQPLSVNRNEIGMTDIITDQCPNGYQDFRFGTLGNPALNLRRDFSGTLPSWCVRSNMRPNALFSLKNFKDKNNSSLHGNTGPTRFTGAHNGNPPPHPSIIKASKK